MDTLEWAVMQILKYEDVHGKVKVQNASLVNSYKNERNKTVDLLIDYKGNDILIELNNNYAGNYMRNMLYAFNIILHHYNMGIKQSTIIKNRCKVILVNLNWYNKEAKYREVKPKIINLTPYPEDDTEDFLIKVININLDLYKDLCYDKINEWDKLWKLLTIQNEKELDLFTKNEKLLKQYQKQLKSLSQDEEYSKMIMNEVIEENAMFEQTYGVGYRNGLEQGIEHNKEKMIINMYQNNISIETIAKCSNLTIEKVREIIKNKDYQ